MRKAVLSVVCIAMAALLGGCTLLPGTLSMLKENLEENTANAAGNRQKEELKAGETEYMPDFDEWTEEELCYEFEPRETGAGLAMEAAMGMQGPEEPMPQWNTEEYRYQEENGWMSVGTSPFSTFAADVDTASYANLRRMLLEGRSVPEDAVRIEEMINYFDYGYAAPSGDDPFAVDVKIAPCPWNEETDLMRIGLKAGEISQRERVPSNLVFLIDVSGSMEDYNKLPLVQRAFRLLADTLDEKDTVSIVTYANEDTVVLEGANGSEKARICDAIEDLRPAGGTNGSQGIVRAYEIAEKYYGAEKNNRVILATDGDLNIGMTDEGSLTRLIREKASTGVYLSVLGFGEGNISDANMEALADHGNGNYSYIDSISEARKVLVGEAGGTLFTVAKDVKLQVEFNPAYIKGYRLIGYENRTMSAESFADDAKDGGEIGSGHTMTALYEIARADSAFDIPEVKSKYTKPAVPDPEDGQGEWATVHIRYKEPEGEESIPADYIVKEDAATDVMDDDFSWAAGVAQAGMLLKGSGYAGTSDAAEIRERLKPLAKDDPIREEFLYLLTKM